MKTILLAAIAATLAGCAGISLTGSASYTDPATGAEFSVSAHPSK